MKTNKLSKTWVKLSTIATSFMLLGVVSSTAFAQEENSSPAGRGAPQLFKLFECSNELGVTAAEVSLLVSLGDTPNTLRTFATISLGRTENPSAIGYWEPLEDGFKITLESEQELTLTQVKNSRTGKDYIITLSPTRKLRCFLEKDAQGHLRKLDF